MVGSVEKPQPSHTAEQPKWALQSKTILGVLAAVLPALLTMCGVQFDDAAAQDIGGAVLTIVGAIIAIKGRFDAVQTLTVLPPRKEGE